MPEIHASTPIHTQGSGIIFSQLEMYKSTDTLKESFKKKKKKPLKCGRGGGAGTYK